MLRKTRIVVPPSEGHTPCAKYRRIRLWRTLLDRVRQTLSESADPLSPCFRALERGRLEPRSRCLQKFARLHSPLCEGFVCQGEVVRLRLSLTDSDEGGGVC